MQTQSTQTAPQQAVLNTPPTVVTTKDLLYIKDQLSWLLLATKKCAHFAKECTDPAIAQVIDKVGRMHQRHYEILLRHVQNDNTAAMANLPQAQRTQ